VAQSPSPMTDVGEPQRMVTSAVVDQRSSSWSIGVHDYGRYSSGDEVSRDTLTLRVRVSAQIFFIDLNLTLIWAEYSSPSQCYGEQKWIDEP
jgi:hypothetical protein